VQANQVEDLTSWFDQIRDVKSRLFPSSFGRRHGHGKIYAMPVRAVQPIILYYNKKVSTRFGVQPPQSWADILDLVRKFNAKGIAPFSLGGQSRWTNMMWLEFCFDRIGGAEVFQAVFDGEKDAWSTRRHQGLTEVQDLVKANGFIKGFSSITADSNADQALLYTGKAAMMLHGSGPTAHEEPTAATSSPAALGWMNFPPSTAARAIRATPSATRASTCRSRRRRRTRRRDARRLLQTGVLADAEVKEWIDPAACRS
jgi:raffinose/stachyose/melibiose transport system substrate-binding protein